MSWFTDLYRSAVGKKAVMAVSGIFANGAPKPMVIGIAISAVIAFVISRFTLHAENSRLRAVQDFASERSRCSKTCPD